MLIVVMKPRVMVKDMGAVLKKIEDMGYQPHISRSGERNLIGIIGEGNEEKIKDSLSVLEGVEQIVPLSQPFKLASREFHPEDSTINLGPVVIGGEEVVVMAGPCAVESREQLLEAAEAVKEAGAKILRGGAFKPRTSPYSFQGLGEKGLEYLAEARERTGLLIVTEVMSTGDITLVARYADIMQVGARNMQNYALLQELGKARHPILLKRGMMSSVEELLMSAEYILSNGNPRVILCERGIRTFEKMTRNTLDISAVPLIKNLCHLPMIVDPSHATGKWELVAPVSKAAVAAGADGLIIEVHSHPEEALSDGPQSLKPEVFKKLMEELKKVAAAVGRKL
ncbi:MAG: 3-deoxy-7-phosphoheptulonate synthase [Firmicutes bacterium]|nr:3-deoxy-7-phosphoheptulonate synthase [Bacillota bacterium]